MDSTVKNWLRSEGVAEQPGIELYLFGSLLTSESSEDVDLVVVYDTSLIDIEKAIAIRRHLRSAIKKVAGMPADIVLLNVHEAEQTQFLNRVSAVHLDKA